MEQIASLGSARDESRGAGQTLGAPPDCCGVCASATEEVVSRAREVPLPIGGRERGDAVGKARLAALGGLLGAVASMSCCILPLAFFTLGISGAWIGNLTALEPYQPLFFAMTAGCLGTGYYLVSRRPKIACANGSCARPLPTRIVQGALWLATALVLAALAFRYLAPLLLGT